MPLLKYRCPECGKRFEELVGFSHTQDVRCPECGAQAQRAFWHGRFPRGNGQRNERLFRQLFRLLRLPSQRVTI